MLGVIGGSGLYQLEGARLIEEVEVPTPFGMPSDALAVVEVEGERIAFLPRHGRGHRLLPGEVPVRANIWALKKLGVEQILSLSSVGSLKEEYRPGELVLCDQLIDRTCGRKNSFFGAGLVGHVSFAEPFCGGMHAAIRPVLKEAFPSFHDRGTLVVMEGPPFSTRAESNLHRGWGADLIGMTALPEAKLAREAEICFLLIAMVTDYDCWKPHEESVTIEMVLKVAKGNTAAIQKLLPRLAKTLKNRSDCPCRHAAENALMTAPDLVPFETRRRLNLFYGRYWKGR